MSTYTVSMSIVIIKWQHKPPSKTNTALHPVTTAMDAQTNTWEEWAAATHGIYEFPLEYVNME